MYQSSSKRHTGPSGFFCTASLHPCYRDHVPWPADALLNRSGLAQRSFHVALGHRPASTVPCGGHWGRNKHDSERLQQVEGLGTQE